MPAKSIQRMINLSQTVFLSPYWNFDRRLSRTADKMLYHIFYLCWIVKMLHAHDKELALRKSDMVAKCNVLGMLSEKLYVTTNLAVIW